MPHPPIESAKPVPKIIILRQFEAGDLVCLKSGGPVMIIAERHDLWLAPEYTCLWFVQGTLHSNRFPSIVLEAAR